MPSLNLWRLETGGGRELEAETLGLLVSSSAAVTCCDLLALSRGAVVPACLLLWDAVKNGKYKGAS